ncbi:MAG: 50S ribosomal protein L21 [Microgenomates group bacterium]
MKLAVVKTGGKQYVVAAGETIIVDNLNVEAGKSVELDLLALLDNEKLTVDLGTPFLKTKAKASVVQNLKGDKIRVARFKAKTRYRKTRGFRAQLTELKVDSF